MTLEQLHIFIAVAEREHLTQAASILHLTPSAVSSAIRVLENFYGVALFDRVGRRIELTEAGRIFLLEARATLARAKAAEQVLADLGGLKRGRLVVQASQTIASYWLPGLLTRFHNAHPSIELGMKIGNTETVTQAIVDGDAEVGFVEGEIDQPALAARIVATDRVVIVVPPAHSWADGRRLGAADLTSARWILREVGSGTRSIFENTLILNKLGIQQLDVALEFPSNEAVMSAVQCGEFAGVVPEVAAAAHLQQGSLVRVNFELPLRHFALLRHKERHRTHASLALERLIEPLHKSPPLLS